MLAEYEKAAAKVTAFLLGLGPDASLADVLRKAAVFALQALEPLATSATLNYAVEMAVQILKAA